MYILMTLCVCICMCKHRPRNLVKEILKSKETCRYLLAFPVSWKVI